MKTAAVILAGGRGSRMNSEFPKQFMLIKNKEIFIRSVELFHGSAHIDKTVLVMNRDWIAKAKESLHKAALHSVEVISGGKTRQESVYNALTFIENQSFDTVMIHDAARPLFLTSQIPELLKLVGPNTGVVVTEPINDTVYIVRDNRVVEIPFRGELRAAQTPQVFNYEEILAAHKSAVKDKVEASTDDVQLFVRMNKSVVFVDSTSRNLKITTPGDIEIAELLLASRT